MNDCLHRFSFRDFPVRGQWVRLNSALAAATATHTYPEPVQTLLAEMLAAVSMFADNLKFDGAVALQSKRGTADAPLIRSLAECRDQRYLRAIAHLDEENDIPSSSSMTSWFGGKAQLALSLIPTDRRRDLYQGMVPLDNPELSDNLSTYFAVSEQLPTRLFFAHDPTQPAVTGLLLQRLPSPDLATEISIAEHDDAWHTVLTLADTVTEQELNDLPVETILGRLFAEFTCHLHPARHLSYRCTCTREKTDQTLRILGRDELEDLLAERGAIQIDCEFCGARYEYDPIDVAALLADGLSSGDHQLH